MDKDKMERFLDEAVKDLTWTVGQYKKDTKKISLVRDSISDIFNRFNRVNNTN